MKNSKPEPKFGPEDYKDLAIIGSIKRGNKEAFSLLFKKYHSILYQRIYFSVYNKEEAEDILMELFQKVYENLDKYEKNYTFNSWLSRVSKNFIIDYARAKKADKVRSNVFSIDRPVEFGDGNEVGFQLQDPSDETLREKVEKQVKLSAIYKAISALPDQATKLMPKSEYKIFHGFHYEGKTPVDLSLEFNMKLKDVELLIKKGYKRYDQGKLERDIMQMYYIQEKSYEEIAKKLRMNINTMKITLMRAKDKIADMVDARRVEMELDKISSMDQLDITGMYTVGV